MHSKKILMTSTALTLAAGMAVAQPAAPSPAPEPMPEAGAARTLSRAGEAAGEVIDKAGDVAKDLAEAGASTLSDTGARAKAALTTDALVTSSEGEVVGTVSGIDTAAGAVMLDLDAEMEGDLDAPVDLVVVSDDIFIPVEDWLQITLTSAELAAAVNTQIARQELAPPG